MNDSRKTRNCTVSLQQLFPQSIIAASDDILVKSCSCRIRPSTSNSQIGHHVFITGTDAGSDTGEEVRAAIAQGATAILTDRLLPVSVPQCIVDDVPEAYAQLANAIKDRPSTKILTVGVVGTHGKTTAALYVAAMLKRLCGKVAYWTTLGATTHGERPTKKDESSAQSVVGWLARAVEDNCPVAVIEISDTMLQSKTTTALEFDVVLIPSFRENQRYEKPMTRYLESSILKTCCQLKQHGMVIYNGDDARLTRWINKHDLPALSYGVKADCSVYARKRIDSDGEAQWMVSAGRSLMPMQAHDCDHVSRHMLGAVAVGYAFGLELNEVIVGVERLTNIPGRMQRVHDTRGSHIIIDRADQADRLAITMHSLQQFGKRTIVVAEVPETSTAEQRAAYGRVLCKTASRVILTQSRASLLVGQQATWEVIDGSDEPARVEVIPNRKAAIELAIRDAEETDLVVLVGMGTESWTPPNAKEACTDESVLKSVLYSISSEPTVERKKAPVAGLPKLKVFKP